MMQGATTTGGGYAGTASATHRGGVSSAYAVAGLPPQGPHEKRLMGMMMSGSGSGSGGGGGGASGGSLDVASTLNNTSRQGVARAVYVHVSTPSVLSIRRSN